MTSGRQLPSPEYASLKSATRTLRKAIGTQADAARATRVLQQQISNYESAGDDHSEEFAPIDVIADLECESGDPIVTRKLAELSGYDLVPLPAARRGGDRLDQITGQMLKELSEVVARLADARADGRITAAECSDLRREIRELIAVLWQLDRQVEAEVAK